MQFLEQVYLGRVESSSNAGGSTLEIAMIAIAIERERRQRFQRRRPKL
jgi:hypothetical protein